MDASIDVWKERILFLIALVASVAVHEFGHAWAANRLGDSLPRSQGRLTLNPIRHADPIGTLLFPLIMMMFPSSFGLLGWGRPVMTNPLNYTRKLSRATGSMLVAVAGPGMNLVMALLVSLVVIAGIRAGFMSPELGDWLIRGLIMLNLGLLFFNLLPIPPLDGGAVLAWALPRNMQGAVDFLNRWGFLILLGLMLTPSIREVVFKPAAAIASAWARVVVGVAIG